MHEEISELLPGYVLGDLSELESFRVREHLAECKQCSSELENLEGLLACTKHMKKLSADEHLGKSAKESLFAAIGSEGIIAYSDRPKTGLVSIWRAVMNNKIIASATAAVIILFVVLGINFVSKQDKAGVAWGSIVDRIEKINSYTVKKRQTTTHPYGPDIKEESDMYYSSKHGLFMNLNWKKIGLNIKVYNSFSDRTSTVIYPSIKKYTRITLSEERVNEVRDFLADPIHMLTKIMSYKFEELGSSIIDGKRVEGIEINDFKYAKGMAESCVARLWVDVETDLPILYEARAIAGNGTSQIEQVFDSVTWDPDLDENIFNPDLSDYSLVAEVYMPLPNEETAVQAFRSFSEIAGGKYPSNLAWETCEKEIGKIYRESKIKEIGLRRAIFFWEEDDFEWESFVNVRVHCSQTCLHFYAQLIKEDKDVAYYGKIVTTEDDHSVFICWENLNTKFLRFVYLYMFIFIYP